MVREKIKKFAQRKIAKDANCPPVQICILDEADSMTIDAQAALRRIIEAHAENTRFCIICNYISKIIDPLASRCVKFRFSNIEGSAQMERLSEICKKEEIQLESDQVLKSLIKFSEGDMRRSINLLQTCSSFVKVSDKKRDEKAEEDKVLTVDTIQEISGAVPDKVVNQLRDQLFEPSSGYAQIQELAEDIILQGYDTQALCTQLVESFIAMETSRKISDVQKARICEILAHSDFNMIQGGDEELNLLNALSQVAACLHNYK